MENRHKNRIYYGIIEGYSYGRWAMVLYLSLYDKYRDDKRVSYKIPVISVYHRLQKLAVYKKDGSLDFEKLEGMPVCAETVQHGSKLYIKTVMSDFPLYGSER